MPRSLRFLCCSLMIVAQGASVAFAQATLDGPAQPADSGFSAGPGAQVAAKLNPAAKDLAEQIYRDLGPAAAPAAVGNTAVGLWMIGRLQVALHLMGKAVAADPGNVDNQCNYAAMLTMSGGAKLAIPVLEKLAKKYPQNSTVLNNLGQAYYLAGQEEEAEKQLTRALAVAPAHPQAAATQSQIMAAKGDAAQAVALAKAAVQRSVSRDKLNQLRKLGYKLTLDDLKASRPADPDPLGLANFVHPAFPKDAVEEHRTRREWVAFYQEIQTRMQSLQQQLFQLQPPAEAAAKAQAAYAKLLSGDLSVDRGASGNPTVQPRARRAKEALDSFIKEKQQLVETEYRPACDQLLREEANQTGEGLANRSLCDKFVALADKYLAKWSDGRETLYNEYLHQLRLKLSEELYWQQFLQPRKEFQATVIKTQLEWLAAFMPSGIRTDGDMGIRVDESCLRQKQAPRGGKLANFNDVHCQYHSELNLLVGGSIIVDCDKMVSTLGVGPVKLGLNQDMAQGTDFFDSFVSCNVEVSAGKSAGVDVGPVSVEVGAEGGLGVEIGRDGIQDVYVTGKVEAGVADAISSGAEARMSLMSGATSANIL